MLFLDKLVAVAPNCGTLPAVRGTLLVTFPVTDHRPQKRELAPPLCRGPAWDADGFHGFWFPWRKSQLSPNGCLTRSGHPYCRVETPRPPTDSLPLCCASNNLQAMQEASPISVPFCLLQIVHL